MKNIILISLAIILSGCNINSEAETIYANIATERVWVFGQFNVPQEGKKIETYYYYGSVSKDIYKSISNNKLNTGFIQLQEVSYWGDNDLIYDYKDGENSGDIIFRIENVAKIRQIKKRPISGQGEEQFDEKPASINPEQEKTRS